MVANLRSQSFVEEREEGNIQWNLSLRTPLK
jgi:hypothetical protein